MWQFAVCINPEISSFSSSVYLVSGRCDPSVVTTIYKHCSTLSVLAHGTFPPRCWHKEVLSTTPATFTLQISAKIHCVVSSKTREDVFTVVVMKLCVNVILLPDPEPLVMLSDWTSLCARGPRGAALSLTWHTGSSEFWQHGVTQDDDKYGE